MPDNISVLIVDDSTELTNVVADFLTMFGYKTSIAFDAQNALTVINGSHIDIVISDIHMPGMDGLCLLEEIRKIDKELPVILITGYSIEAARISAGEKGADAFLAKPFHIKELKKTIEKIILKRHDKKRGG